MPMILAAAVTDRCPEPTRAKTSTRDNSFVLIRNNTMPFTSDPAEGTVAQVSHLYFAGL